jgi:hypothetical protein
MGIFFQNCHAHPCGARVVLQSRRQFLSLRRLPFPGIDVNVECEGGAYGACVMEWPIPAGLQGQTFECEVAARVRHPAGRGPLLRPHWGAGVFTPDVSGTLTRFVAGMTVEFFLHDSMSYSMLTLRLPEGVAEEPVDDAQPETEILCRPADVAR